MKRMVLNGLRVLLALPFLLAGLFVLNGVFTCDGERSRYGEVVSEVALEDSTEGQLRVMAFNLAKCFVYEGETDFAQPDDVRKRLRGMAAIIKTENPDVLCLSEVVRECGPCNVDQVRFIAEETGLKYWAFGECFSFGFPGYRIVSGNAVLSRFPVKPLKNLTLAGRKPFYVSKNNRRALACELSHPEGLLVQWSLHNDSFNLTVNHAQVKQLLADPLSQGAFMAGDFNAMPETDSMQAFQQSDRFVGVFDGPLTFPADLPSRTIDYVLAPLEWRVVEHKVIPNSVSDHCAVLTVFDKK